jgi:hypothetical protein
MPAGLQVFDRNNPGNLLVDTTTKVGRILGFVTVYPGDVGSQNDPGLATGQAFAVPCIQFSPTYEPLSSDPGVLYPNIVFSGSSISWSVPNTRLSNPPSFIIYYGVY